MSKQKTFTLEFRDSEIHGVRDALSANNWIEEVDRNEYVVFRFRSPNDSIAIMYRSGKLVFQGKEDFTSLISSIKKGKEDEEVVDFVPHLGVDEVGKGDYFGPLVVASCFVTEEFLKKVSILGFADSKRFSDRKIKNLYENVKDYPYYYYSIVHPSEYNELIERYRNVSILLAKQHSLVIEKGLKNLKSKDISCEYVVVDQFSTSKSRVKDELGELGKVTELIQHHKGESDIAVASASIIARGVFVKEWERMNNKYSFKFPKGASNVIDKAKEFVSIYGVEELKEVAKISFRTTKQVLEGP